VASLPPYPLLPFGKELSLTIYSNENFYDFLISTFHRGPRKIITVFHQEILLLKKLRKLYSPKGREGVRGKEATKWPLTLTTLRVVEGTGGSPYFSTFHRGPRKIITVFHQKILLLKKLRKLYSPKGREGVRGNRGFPLPYLKLGIPILLKAFDTLPITFAVFARLGGLARARCVREAELRLGGLATGADCLLVIRLAI
jgi:hypothetical protein